VRYSVLQCVCVASSHLRDVNLRFTSQRCLWQIHISEMWSVISSQRCEMWICLDGVWAIRAKFLFVAVRRSACVWRYLKTCNCIGGDSATRFNILFAAVCCRVLRCVAVRVCGVISRYASVLLGFRRLGAGMRAAACCSALLRVAVCLCACAWYCLTIMTHSNTLQHTATHCNTLQHNTLQHTATHCNTLQHTATHCSVMWLCAWYSLTIQISIVGV